MPPTTTHHEHAAVIAIGDEITLGEHLDTNTRWIAEQLVELGITVDLHIAVPDDLARITDAISLACERAELVICTGGLGPTADDLTRQALAAAAGERLVTDAGALKAIERWFEARSKELMGTNAVQALRPESGACLDNPLGTAPGLSVRVGDVDVFCLPGPPREMMPMFEQFVAPALRPAPGRRVIARIFLAAGIGESAVAHKLGELMDRGRNPNISTTASLGTVTCRLRFAGEETEESRTELGALESQMIDRIGDFVIASGGITLAEQTVRALSGSGTVLVSAESCTGGMVGEAVTAVAGSSAVYLGGCVSYHNETKIKQLGVARETIERFGAVSGQAALEMARGALERYTHDPAQDACSISITGIAGPSGGSDEKPVGTVYICVCLRKNGTITHEDTRRFRFPGQRQDVRERATVAALTMLNLVLRGATRPTLLWQII